MAYECRQCQQTSEKAGACPVCNIPMDIKMQNDKPMDVPVVPTPPMDTPVAPVAPEAPVVAPSVEPMPEEPVVPAEEVPPAA